MYIIIYIRSTDWGVFKEAATDIHEYTETAITSPSARASVFQRKQ